MNGIQGRNPAGQQWNTPLDTMVTVPKYKKITIDHDIYIKAFSDGTISHFIFSTDDVLNTNHN